ncbi:MAG: Rossmann-fold NAD(P)-binding domain-containing protein, partial [Planctomycetota bacterium]
ALAFREAAAAAGVRRIVYLGGVQPAGRSSTHLNARMRTGEILRSGPVSTVELRAGMIVGAGSASWQIVMGLAQRLPLIVLPSWLTSHSWPVGVHDVIRSLLAALTAERGGCYELPGPARISHRKLLELIARALGRRLPVLSVPLLGPRLSSYGVAALTGVDRRLVGELLEGIRVDLDPTGPTFWGVMGDHPQSLGIAIRSAVTAAPAA